MLNRNLFSGFYFLLMLLLHCQICPNHRRIQEEAPKMKFFAKGGIPEFFWVASMVFYIFLQLFDTISFKRWGFQPRKHPGAPEHPCNAISTVN